MKKALLLTVFLTFCLTLFSQNITSIDYFKWSDPTTFHLSPSPLIKGYGYYSDSLSNVFGDKAFYEYNNEYFCIDSWADYYYWYTKKFWFQFENPALYEYYYWSKNDLGMASFIASYDYKGEYYPTSIKLIFKDRDIVNRLSSNKYIARNDRQITRLTNNKQYYKTANKSDTPKKLPDGYNQRVVRKDLNSRNKIQTVNTRSSSVSRSTPQSQSKSAK